MELLLDAGMDNLRAKSAQQTDYLIRLWETHFTEWGFTLYSPRDVQRRGSHVALAHPDAWRINRALIEQVNVLPDFRRPNAIRFGIAPLYTSFMDIYTAFVRLQRVMAERLYEAYDDVLPEVT